MPTLIKTIVIVVLVLVCILFAWLILFGRIEVDNKCAYQGPLAKDSGLCKKNTGDIKGVSATDSDDFELVYSMTDDDYGDYVEKSDGNYTLLIPQSWYSNVTASSLIAAPLQTEHNTAFVESIRVIRLMRGEIDTLTHSDCEKISEEVRLQFGYRFDEFEVKDDGLMLFNDVRSCYMFVKFHIEGDEGTHKRFFIPDEDTDTIYILEIKYSKGSIFQKILEKTIMSFQLD